MENAVGNGKTILIVEDEPSICELCQQVLSAEGFDVDIAGNGRVAEAMIENRKYDICLVDIRMPSVNGKELYKWLLDNKPETAKLVIFTSGDTMDGETEEFLQRAGRPFLPKPFTPAQLCVTIKNELAVIEKIRSG